MTDLAAIARAAAQVNADLRAAIVTERAKGRTLEAIAQECGMTRAGVAYIVNKAGPPAHQ